MNICFLFPFQGKFKVIRRILIKFDLDGPCLCGNRLPLRKLWFPSHFSLGVVADGPPIRPIYVKFILNGPCLCGYRLVLEKLWFPHSPPWGGS